MSRLPFRVRQAAESLQRRAGRPRCARLVAMAPGRLAALALLCAPLACATYDDQRAPIDLADVLTALDVRRWHALDDAGADVEGARPRQLAAFAITHNPTLQAARARVGVSEALLLQAGLLADPEIGWDGMDVLASQVVDGSSSAVEALSGLGLSITVPRPGELDAREGAARWRVEEARRQVTRAEWLLARDVHVACEDVLEAQRLLEQNTLLLQLAESNRDYFERAKAAGAATAIQANLATGGLLEIRAGRVALGSRLRETRQALNALLGLPPQVQVPLLAAPLPADESDADAAQLVQRALTLRPDLAATMAAYEAAEEDLRLEVARQFPRFTVGTGLWFVPGLFSGFNRRAVETAMARRDELRAEVAAQVHELRREVYDAYAEVQEAREELAFLEAELLPNAEESLRLTSQAFGAGEVTLLEILTLQRVLVAARTRTTKARAELQRRSWRLLAADGSLLATTAPAKQDEDQRDP